MLACKIIHSKSASGWRQAIFIFGAENWEGQNTPYTKKYLIDWDPRRFIQIERRAKNQQLTEKSTSLKCSANDPVGRNEGGQHLWI